MIVRFNVKAEDDLEALADYIARDDPVRAVTFIREIRARCADLPTFPERFPHVRRYEHQGIRRCLHGKYLIFYRIEDDAVAVLHVLHGSRDYTTILLLD